jgi:hypothetical protein
MQANARSLQNFAVDVPCFHQAKSREGRLPKGFFVNWNYLCEKWKPYLPIHTLTGTLHHKRSFVLNNFKEFVKERLGCVSEPWWRNLPTINPDRVLHEIDESHLGLAPRD